MRITIAAIGKYKREPLAEACAEYVKRLPYRVEIKEFEAKSGLSGEVLKEKEAELLLKAFPEKALVIALDERGKALTSREFASVLKQAEENGREVAFVIGGADGLSEDLKKRADRMVCFGSLTWPHKMVRVMLLEQLYRAYTINTNHPYHRD